MKKSAILFGLFFFFLYSFPCNGSDTLEIKWDDLVPEMHQKENPLAGLSEEETGFIEWIIYLREYLPDKIQPEDQEVYDEMNEALPKLKEKGIDVDKIIADRRLKNSSINTKLDGQKIKLAGYLLPLELSGNEVTEFLLVPYVGACIHTPPPPPNQIVQGVINSSAKYKADELFKPVVVTGKLKAKSLSRDLYLVDGSSNIDIGYSIRVGKIEEYKP